MLGKYAWARQALLDVYTEARHHMSALPYKDEALRLVASISPSTPPEPGASLRHHDEASGESNLSPSVAASSAFFDVPRRSPFTFPRSWSGAPTLTVPFYL